MRSAYRSYLADGLDGTTATDKLLADFQDSVDDPDDGPSLWLALAATQWRSGRLEERVRDRALAIIDNGMDLARFPNEPILQRKRAKVLAKLREQLCSPQPAAVRVRPDTPLECDWQAGEIISFQRDSGEWLPLHVQGIVERDAHRYPLVCILDLPIEQAHEATPDTPIRTLNHKVRFGPCPDCFQIIGMKRRDLSSPRITRIGHIVPPHITVTGDMFGIYCLPWKHLDRFLTKLLQDS